MAPTWDVPVLFFRQTTDLIVYVPLLSADFSRFTVNPAVTGSSPRFSQKLFRAFAKPDETEGSPFFGTVRLFFPNFFCLHRVPPSKFFDILQQTKVPKSPKGLPFYICRHYETVSKFSFSV